MNQDFSRDVTDEFTVVPDPDFAPEVVIERTSSNADLVLILFGTFLVALLGSWALRGGSRGR